MKKLVTAILFILLINTSSFGQSSNEYSKTLKHMFEISGTEKSYQSAIEQMFTMFKQQYPSVPSNVWEDLKKEFSKTSLDDLTKMLVPVYSKHLTVDDLKQLIEFYQTPVGKKFAKKTPLIMKESIQVGQEWGMKIGQDFKQKMEEKGY